MKNVLLLISLIFSGFVWGQKNVNWSSLNMTSPVNQYVASISVVDTQVIWGACWKGNFTENEVFRTIDGGASYDLFQLPATATSALIYQVFAIDADTAFAAVSNANGNNVEGIFRTKDGGSNWSLVFDSQQEGLAVFQLHFFDGQAGVLMGHAIGSDVTSLFYYTADGGDSWAKSTTQFTSPCIYIESAGANYAAVGDSIWYAGGVKNMIFHSTDRGQNWILQALPAGTNASILDIAFKNHLEGLALSSFLCGSGDTDNLIFQTQDGGQTWTYLTTIKFPFYLAEANNLEYIPGTSGSYITTSGVEPGNLEGFFSNDDGQSWTPIWAPSEVFVMEFLSPAHGFAGTHTQNGGLLSYQDDLFTYLDEQISLNKQLVVFPNPTTDHLYMELINAWRGNIALRCYDVYGRELFSQEMYKTDKKALWEITMKRYPSGKYLLVLSDGKELVTKAFIVR